MQRIERCIVRSDVVPDVCRAPSTYGLNLYKVPLAPEYLVDLRWEICSSHALIHTLTRYPGIELRELVPQWVDLRISQYSS